MLHSFKEAALRGPYDEYPVLTPEVDPQLHLSRNDRRQPFFLICEKDCMLVQMSGRARIEFRDCAVRWMPAVPGDFIYVPARTPHRIVPSEPSVHYRYKARAAGLEAACWYCPRCDNRIALRTWDTAEELPQEGYLRWAEAFNADSAWRSCARCGFSRPRLDLAPFRWREIARELRMEADLDEL
jgi:3-hydroxyanthranilate 3,4-dioxygenase